MSSSLYADVCRYADRGFTCIPMRDGAKKPAVKWKRYQDEPPPRRTLNRWFRDRDDYTGVAVLFGRASGNLGQRDFDDRAAYDSWATENPSLAATLPTVATSRDRRHVYFGVDPSDLQDLRSRLSKPGNGSIKLDRGELRADVGCYSLLPRSKHPSGTFYEWVTPLPDRLPIVDLAAFVPTTIDVSPECYTCNVSAALACDVDAYGQNQNQNQKNSKPTDPLLKKVDSLLEESVQAAIDATLPAGPGQRNRMIFEFVRHLKAIPGLAHADPKALEPLIRRWHAQALPSITTKGFTETLTDFVTAWRNAKFAAGTKAIEPIFQRALVAEIPAVARRYDDEPKLQLLVSLCRELQRACAADHSCAARSRCRYRKPSRAIGIPPEDAAHQGILC